MSVNSPNINRHAHLAVHKSECWNYVTKRIEGTVQMWVFKVTTFLIVLAFLFLGSCSSQIKPQSIPQETPRPNSQSNQTPQASTANQQPTNTIGLLRFISDCKKTLQEMPTQPIDVNNDGIIDSSDALELMSRANDQLDRTIKPLLNKTGIVANNQGDFLTPDNRNKLDVLTNAEKNELIAAVNKFNTIKAQICATVEAAARNKK